MKRLADLHAAIRWLLVSAFACVLLAVIAGCGGGSSDARAAAIEAPAAAAETPLPWDYLDFAAFRESRTGTWSGGTWHTTVNGNDIGIRWGKTVERFRIVGAWICLDAFENDGEPPHRIRTTLAEISTDAGATWQPLVHPCAGHPYAPRQIDRAFSLRVWGYVEHLQFFWQHTLTPMRNVRNTCWTGPAPQVRDVLHQQEVWWAAGNGWYESRGTGHLRDGIPDGTGIVYSGWYQSIGRDAGHMWVSSAGCLSK